MADAELAVLFWLVPLALLHGLIYLVIAPPWQHYDEPAHFLYVAEIAAGEVEQRGPLSVDLTRTIAASMYRFRFFPPGVQPDLTAPEPALLGFDQRLHPPLYYTLAALPVRWLLDRPVEEQLFAGRMVSVILYMLTVVTAWRIAVTLSPASPLLQHSIPLLVLLSPPFADIMTAVNNDVLLNFSLTVVILGAVLLIRDGLRPLPLALIGVGMVVAFMTKRTALVMLFPLGFAMIWALLRRPVRWWVMPLIGTAALLALGFAMLEPAVVGGPAGDHVVLSVRPWFAALDQHYLRLYLNETIQSFTDPTLIGDRYRVLVVVLFSDMYTRVGWGHISLHAAWLWALAGLVVVALAGLALGGSGAREDLALWQRRSLWLFLIIVSVGWFSLFVRLHPLPPLDVKVYIPRGRYMYWTMVPNLWLLALGLTWAAPRRWRTGAAYALLAFFACLDMAAWMWTMVGYYYQ